MRIEISAGGILCGSMADLQSSLSSYISDAENMISSFKTIESSTYSLNGGAGTLQTAADQVSSRISGEETKLQDAKSVQTALDKISGA